MYKVSAIGIGMMIAIMVFFNGTLNMHLDSFTAGVFIHIVGIVVVGAVLMIKREKNRLDRSIPLHLMSGGLYGVLLVVFNSYCFIKIGATLTLTLGLFGQMLFSAAVDHFGLLGMNRHELNPKKLIGFGIVSLGVVIMTLG